MIRQLGGRLTDRTLSAVRKKILHRKTPTYQQDAEAFAYLYYCANYVKSLLVAKDVVKRLRRGPLVLADLGVGAGASTAALVIAAVNGGHKISRLLLNEQCRTQRRLFDRSTGLWLKEQFPDIRIEWSCLPLQQSLTMLPKDVSVLAASYVRCELGSHINHFDKAIETYASQSHTELVVIDQLLNKDGTFFKLKSRPWTKVHTSGLAVRADELYSLPVTFKPKFVLKAERCRQQLPSVVSDYFYAWKSHDIKKLSRIFSQDSTYTVRGPNGCRQLQGLPAICKYWLENRKQQRQVCWEVNPCVVYEHEDRSLLFPWITSFDRVDKDEHYQLLGHMSWRVKGGKIDRLDEHFSISKKAIRNPQPASCMADNRATQVVDEAAGFHGGSCGSRNRKRRGGASSYART